MSLGCSALNETGQHRVSQKLRHIRRLEAARAVSFRIHNAQESERRRPVVDQTVNAVGPDVGQVKKPQRLNRVTQQHFPNPAQPNDSVGMFMAFER